MEGRKAASPHTFALAVLELRVCTTIAWPSFFLFFFLENSPGDPGGYTGESLAVAVCLSWEALYQPMICFDLFIVCFQGQWASLKEQICRSSMPSLGRVAHSFNPMRRSRSWWISVSLKLALSVWQVPGQPMLYSETLSQTPPNGILQPHKW